MKELKKIIYIDSDREHRDKARKAFDTEQYRCILCATGREGLETISREDPSAVIVDYQLPDISGEELYIQFLAANKFSGLRDVPFIALTTNGHVSRPHLYKLGYSGILGKPFESSELAEFVDDSIVAHKLKMEEVQFWETIREAKDFLERVVESSIDAIVTTDTRGVITYCNAACEELLGYRFEELIGERVALFFNGSGGELMKLYEMLKTSNRIRDYASALKSKEGRTLPVLLSICRMKSSSGQVMGALGIIKRVNENGTVQNTGGDSQRVAAIVETAVAVNHAINNPLVPILGNAQLLLQDKSLKDEKVRQRLRIIVKNALRIRDITKKLAKISHPVTVEYLRGTQMLDIEKST